MIPRLTKSLGGRAPLGQHGNQKAWRASRRSPGLDSWEGMIMRIKSRHRFCLAVLAALAIGVARADAQSPEFAASFARATTALYEMVNVPDGNGIPREALAKAHAVAVFPGVVKGALLIGGTSGDGIVTARRPNGSWSPPAIFRMAGGSLGFQIGAEITDCVRAGR